MRCPYCGDRRTEVLKTVYRGHSSYRHRRCLYCGSRFSTQERPVRWSRVDRKWPGRPPLRKGWGGLRTPALRGKCEVETCGVDFKQAGIRRHVDHIVPARLIRRLTAGNPDRRENLQCICATCHGYKLQADHKLCMGDKLGYLEVRDPRITKRSMDDLWRSKRGLGPSDDQKFEVEASASEPQMAAEALLEHGSVELGKEGAGALSTRSSRARRFWAEAAETLQISQATVAECIAQGTLKLCDPRITEKSLRNFCRRHGSLINYSFLNQETRAWLKNSMDFVPTAGETAAKQLGPFRKHAQVVRSCKHCGRHIRGNVYFRHIKRCQRAASGAREIGPTVKAPHG